MIKNNKNGSINTIIILLIVLILGVLVYFATMKKSEPVVQQQNVKSTTDIASLQFNYENDIFSLKKELATSQDNIYDYRAGDNSTVRFYTFILNDPKFYTQGSIDGVDTRLFILQRGSGANIIETILFAFQNDNNVWKQVAYTKLPPDGGRTGIDNFIVKNDSIVLDVKISGPDKNYHEVYVPKNYVYKISNSKLILH